MITNPVRCMVVPLMALLGYPCMSQTDSIRMVDGTVYQGRIVSSSDTAIAVRSGSNKLLLSKSLVMQLTFATSDWLVTTTGDSIPCKVLSNERGIFTVATGNGICTWSEAGVLRVRYNSGRELLVQSVPATDSYFHPSTAAGPGAEKTTGRIFFAASVGTHRIPALPTYVEGGSIVRLELGVALSSGTALGFAYERFQTAEVSQGVRSGIARGRYGYDMVCISLRPGTRVGGKVPLSVFAIIAPGFLDGSGEFTSDGPGQPSAPRGGGGSVVVTFGLGLRWDFSDIVSVTCDGKYLHAPDAGFVEINGDQNLHAPLDMSGLSASLGLEVRFSPLPGL